MQQEHETKYPNLPDSGHKHVSHVLVWFLSSNYVWTFGSFSLYKETKTLFLYVSLTVSFFLFTRNHVETPGWCWESSSTTLRPSLLGQALSVTPTTSEAKAAGPTGGGCTCVVSARVLGF